jgi:hypothetical protein
VRKHGPGASVDGRGASPQRWAFTVALLVSLASLPTLAAISAGSATLGQATEPDGTTPFIAQPSSTPVVIIPQPPTPLPPPAAAAEATYPRRPSTPRIRERAPAWRPSPGRRRPVTGGAAATVRPHIVGGRAWVRNAGPDTHPRPACKRPVMTWRPMPPHYVPTPRCR